MFKKVLAVMLIITTIIIGAPVSFENASQIAQNVTKNKKINLKHQSFKKQGKLRASNEVLLYVFQNDGDNGFVIVSGDDVFKPIIGISDKGSFDSDDLPPNFVGYIENIEREMEFALENGQIQTLDIKKEWELYAAGAPYVVGSYLVKTLWNQREPYWGKTPTISGTKTLTGCVATAMAQIMKYHQHPEKTTATIPAYVSERGLSVSALPSPVTFNWSSMSNTYSAGATNDAVATLMNAVGRAVEMDYGTSSSGAYVSGVAPALTTYFDYDYRTELLFRDYTDGDWESILKEQIDLSLPVFYGGQNSSGTSAHAFVLDGYNSSGQFHFNWGWGGSADGWFVTTVLKPNTSSNSYDFSYLQYAVINIKPSDISNSLYGDLIDAANKGGMYALETDIIGDSKMPFQLNVMEDFILDLNGYKLTIEVTGSNNGIKISSGKRFTIMDSRSGGILDVSSKEGVYGYTDKCAAINTTGGTLIVESGKINASGGIGAAGIGGGFYGNGGDVIINGGIINAKGGYGADGIGKGYDGTAGTFTMNGNAVVFTDRIGNDDESRKIKGIIFDVFSGYVYGSVELQENLAVKEYSTLYIPDSSSLIINKGITLTIPNYSTLTNEGAIISCGNIVGKIDGNQPIKGEECDDTPIFLNPTKNDKYGIKLTQNPAFDKVEISVVLPNNEKIAEAKIVIYDNLGNIVFRRNGKYSTLTWDLTNNAGRFVANGTYLIIAEIKTARGTDYHYSAKLGVKR